MWPNEEDMTDLDSIICGMYFSVYDQAICVAFCSGDIVIVHLGLSEEVNTLINKFFFQIKI